MIAVLMATAATDGGPRSCTLAMSAAEGASDCLEVRVNSSGDSPSTVWYNVGD